MPEPLSVVAGTEPGYLEKDQPEGGRVAIADILSNLAYRRFRGLEKLARFFDA